MFRTTAACESTLRRQTLLEMRSQPEVARHTGTAAGIQFKAKSLVEKHMLPSDEHMEVEVENGHDGRLLSLYQQGFSHFHDVSESEVVYSLNLPALLVLRPDLSFASLRLAWPAKVRSNRRSSSTS